MHDALSSEHLEFEEFTNEFDKAKLSTLRLLNGILFIAVENSLLAAFMCNFPPHSSAAFPAVAAAVFPLTAPCRNSKSS